MEDTIEKVYEEIKEIFKKNDDAQKGFEKAAENAKTPGLKAYFRKKSEDRKEFNQKLAKEIRIVYTDFDSSFTGTMHRAWMDVTALFSADNDESMLEESIRGDEAAVDEYSEILESTKLPVGLRLLLSDQMHKIKTDISHNKRLEDVT